MAFGQEFEGNLYRHPATFMYIPTLRGKALFPLIFQQQSPLLSIVIIPRKNRASTAS